MLPGGFGMSPYAILLGTVRDPLDRILSEHTHKFNEFTTRLNLSDWVRSSGARVAVSNSHVRRFCGPSCFAEPALNGTHLQMALDNLVKFTAVIPVANLGVSSHLFIYIKYCARIHM